MVKTATAKPKKPGPKQGDKYPLKEWLGMLRTNAKKKDTYLILEEGVDYKIALPSMRHYLWRWARQAKIELCIRTEILDGKPTLFLRLRDGK